ncbi:MAG: 2'-5' RNA ligase family protein, partial [Rhodoferax sp.]|nr:2'-5' RNA ligase family protein [Rhodoferax sp.]
MPAPASRAEALTLRNERRDFTEWHLGRPDYALWALQFDTRTLLPRLRAAQAHMAPWLLAHYTRQPHITLSLCGFPSRTPRHPDDYGLQRFQAQVAALRELRPQPFEISIGALDTFSSVPYFSVQEPGGHLQALRHCLDNRALPAAMDDYTPHVTVGLYADAWPLHHMQA